MTKIKYNLPEEFKKREYIFDLHLLLEEYEKSFHDNLKEILIKIEVKIGNPLKQCVNTFELNDSRGVLTIPFKRHSIGNKLSDLPTVNDFYSAIKFALDKTVRDCNNN